METRYFGDAANGGVADADEYIGAERQVYVDARAEFDEAQVLVDASFVARLGVGDDAAGYGACNLSNQYVLAAGGFNQNSRTLVLGARFG